MLLPESVSLIDRRSSWCFPSPARQIARPPIHTRTGDSEW
jgi:hypothetical protein